MNAVFVSDLEKQSLQLSGVNIKYQIDINKGGGSYWKLGAFVITYCQKVGAENLDFLYKLFKYLVSTLSTQTH